MLFRALNKPQRMLSVPIALMDAPIAILDGLARLFPGINDTAEFGRIGRYYAGESMLVWDEQKQCYDADAIRPMEPTRWSSSLSVARTAWLSRTWGMRRCSEAAILWVTKPPMDHSTVDPAKAGGRSTGVLLHPAALPGSPVCGSFGEPCRWLQLRHPRHRGLADAA